MYILKSKLKTKNLSLKNRLVMPPMATSKSTPDGLVTDEIIKYYDEKTKSKKISLVIVEHCFVEPRGKANPLQMSIQNDTCIDGLKKLVDTIHKNESLAIAQLAHSGSSALSSVIGEQPISCSPIINPSKTDAETPRELNNDEIKIIIKYFINAAVRAKKSGFDGVEIHSAHGYLLNQFLSPITNKRTDEYGGDIYSRIKIHSEIIYGIKKELGDNYPVLIRIGAGDYSKDGLSIEDAIKASKHFEKLGVEILDISGGLCSYRIIDTKPGYFSDLTNNIKKNVNIPVILTGGIKTAVQAEKFLKNGDADLIGIGRALLKDSNWVEKEMNFIENKS